MLSSRPLSLLHVQLQQGERTEQIVTVIGRVVEPRPEPCQRVQFKQTQTATVLIVAAPIAHTGLHELSERDCG